ncbi:MAG: peptidoglycan DD-metalloendopeptidase family protein [Pseudomonadota bacterium]
MKKHHDAAVHAKRAARQGETTALITNRSTSASGARLDVKTGANDGPRFASALILMVSVSVVVLTGAVFTMSQVGFAQDNPQKYREQLRNEKNRLEGFKSKAEKLDTGMAALREERLKLNQQLLDTAERIQDSEAQMSDIESKLGGLQEQETLLRGSLAQQHTQIATLLGSLQRMGRNPPPVMMTHRDDALAMVRSAMLLARAFPGLRDKALSLSSRLNELVRVMTAIQAQGDALRVETAKLNDSRVRLSGLLSEKKQTITQRQAELKIVQRATAEITRNVNNLSDMITKLDKAVTENTQLAAYNAKVEKEMREQVLRPEQPSVAEVPPAPDRPRIPPASDSELLDVTPPKASSSGTQVAILAPPSSAFAGASADRIEPAVPFHRAKRQLPFPARGKRVMSYGGKTEYGGKSKGIVFQTRAAAQITSPCDGWVVYAGEFRSYGKLLIINAGGGYHILLAGLSHIDVEPGQFILAAEPVGTMGDGPSGSGTSGNGPVLYVEFRKSGRPIDPDPWWVKSPQKV